MALTDESYGGVNLSMPVQPMNYGYPSGGFGNGFGGDESWLILFIILAMSGNWGGFGGFGGGNALGYDFPWLLNANNATDALISNGFNQAATTGALSGIQSSITSGFGDVQNALCGGFGNVQNSLCSGFAGVNASINGAQNALAQQMYGNQIADLERSFNAQTANTQAMNGIATSLQNCCCENRANIADLKYTVATENCADRAAVSDGIRDILTATQAQT